MSVPRSFQIGNRKDAPHIMGCVSLLSHPSNCMHNTLQFPSCSSCVKETAIHDWHSTYSVLCYSEHSSSVFQGRSILCLIKSWHQYNLWHDCIELDRLLTLFEVVYVYSMGCPFKTRSLLGWQKVVSCHGIKIAQPKILVVAALQSNGLISACSGHCWCSLLRIQTKHQHCSHCYNRVDPCFHVLRWSSDLPLEKS